MAEIGRLTYTNLELTTLVKELQRHVTFVADNSNSQRLKTVLSKNSLELTPNSLSGTILIVPNDLGAETQYRLPPPRDLLNTSRKRNYDIFIRNDSPYDVTIVSSHIRSSIDGPNTISAQTGSQWYISFTSIEEGREAYLLTRLT
jgi:hypothetical protein